jgi:hypothetical protein
VDPHDVLASFLQALGVAPEAIPPNTQARTLLFRSMLSDRRLLLFLDDVRGAQDVRLFLPGGGTCAVIAAGRSDLSGLVVRESAHRLVLGPLSGDESREILTRRIGGGRTEAEPEAVAALAEHCAGVPLALSTVAARAVLQRHFSLAQIVDELRDGTLEVAMAKDPSAPQHVTPFPMRALVGQSTPPGPGGVPEERAAECEQAPSELTGHAMEALGPTEQERVDGHVRQCAHCATELSAIRATVSGLQRLPAEELLGDWTDTFPQLREAAVRAALRDDAPVASADPRPAPRPCASAPDPRPAPRPDVSAPDPTPVVAPGAVRERAAARWSWTLAAGVAGLLLGYGTPLLAPARSASPVTTVVGPAGPSVLRAAGPDGVTAALQPRSVGWGTQVKLELRLLKISGSGPGSVESGPVWWACRVNGPGRGGSTALSGAMFADMYPDRRRPRRHLTDGTDLAGAHRGLRLAPVRQDTPAGGRRRRHPHRPDRPLRHPHRRRPDPADHPRPPLLTRPVRTDTDGRHITTRPSRPTGSGTVTSSTRLALETPLDPVDSFRGGHARAIAWLVAKSPEFTQLRALALRRRGV